MQAVPKTREELRGLASDVFRRLVESYHNSGDQFVDGQNPNATGLIYRCAGSISLLLMVHTFDELREEKSWREIVLKEFQQVAAYVREQGYDASPLLAPTQTVNLFSPKAPERHHYMDGVSWTLSFSILMRLSWRRSLIRLEPATEASLTEIYRETLAIVCDGACPGGGWGFADGCTKPDLYYSYAVAEALADFGDYVLGETPEIIGADTEWQKALGPLIVGRVEEVRKRASEWLIREYLPVLGRTAINPYGLEADDHILLYYSYFVIDMLVVCAADLFFPDRKAEIQSKIEHGIYLSRIHFDQAFDDKLWWNNATASSLDLRFEHHPNLQKVVDRIRIKLQEPGLIPLSLRCNSLYASYFGKVDTKIETLFDLVAQNRDEDTGLWDATFSLLVTERAVEAIVDYADYLAESGVKPIGGTTPRDSSFHRVVAEEVREFLKSPEGRLLLPTPTPGIATADDARDEEKMIELMTAVLTKAPKIIAGEEKGLPKIKVTLFRNRMHDFLIDLLADRLMEHVRNADGFTRKAMNEALLKREKELMAALASWLPATDTIDLGDLFMWLSARGSEQAAVNKAAHDDSRRPKRG